MNNVFGTECPHVITLDELENTDEKVYLTWSAGTSIEILGEPHHDQNSVH